MKLSRMAIGWSVLGLTLWLAGPGSDLAEDGTGTGGRPALCPSRQPW